MTTEAKPAGDLINSLGVEITIPEGHLVSDTVLVAKVIGDDGPYIKVCSNPGLDWITKRALLDIAAEQEHGGYDDEEDDE